MAGFLQDLRFTLRTLRKSKGFTVVAVLALAAGIGGTTVMYSAVDGILMRPLPYPEASRLVELWSLWGNGGFGSVSWPDLLDWKAQSRRVELMTGVSLASFTLVHGQDAEAVMGTRVTSDFFRLLGVQPALGRAFTAESYTTGTEVLLSNDVWRHSFNASPDVLGQAVRLTDKSYTIVGVMPASFRLPYTPGGVYVPYAPDEHALERGSHFMMVFGRLAPGETLATATSELKTITKALEAEYPASNKDRSVLIRSWSEALTASLRPIIWLLFGAVVLVLVIACANVANMLIARAASRQSELALRFALGATRGRVVRQILTECALLAAGGGAVGVLFAVWGVDACRAILPRNFLLNMSLDGRALLFAAGVAAISVFVFGLVPALRASQGDVAGTLKEGQRTVARRSRMRSALVVVQVALSFALLVGAALLGKSFASLLDVDPGFDPRGVLTAQLALPPGGDPRPFYDRLLERVRAIPQVTSAGIVDFLPLSSNNTNGDFEIEGKTFDDPNRHTEYMVATPGYFETMRIATVYGRGIQATDTKDSEPVCVVNQEMARKYFGEDNPVGKHMRFDKGDPWMTVVGVVRDVKRWSIDGTAVPETYTPFAQQPWPRMALAVRGNGAAGPLGEAIRREIAAIDPNQAAFDIATMSATIDDSLRSKRLLLQFTSVFSGLALALAAIGLYGVLAVMVAQRTHELGIRMALGARPADVSRLVVVNGVSLTLGGVAVGVVGAILLSSLFGKLLYGVAPTDIPTYLAVGAALVFVSFVAAFVPARRATRIDPMIAMRAS